MAPTRRSCSDGCTWKSSGCYAVDYVLYWVVARHKYGENKERRPRQAPDRRQREHYQINEPWPEGVRSAKENYENPTFPSRRFATPYFVEYGQDGCAAVDNEDKFIYAASNNGF